MKKHIIIFCVMFLTLSLLAPLSFAAPVGKVEIVINTAHELEQAKLDWERLLYADPVMAESLLRTLEDSKLKVSLIDGSILLLTENSKTRVENVSKEEKSFLRMFTGKMRAIVKKVVSPKKKFEVRTPTAIVGVKGTDFAIFLNKDVTEVLVFDGEVTVSNILDEIPGEVNVKANYYTRVTRFSAPTQPEELPMGAVDKFARQYGLTDEVFIEEYEEGKGKGLEKGKPVTEVKEPDIEGTTESDIEKPVEIIDDIEDFGDKDFEDEIIDEPDYEDVTPKGIQDPPLPPTNY